MRDGNVKNRKHQPRSLSVLTLALSLLLALILWTSSALANNGKTNGRNSRGGAQSPEPIVLYDGSVTETATDFSLPGVTFGWSHTRNYSSSLTMSGDGMFIQGEKWQVASFTMYFKVESVDTIGLYVDHLHKRVFTKNQDGSYTGPADFLATLTEDTGAKRFTLKMTQTGETFKFYNFDASLGGEKGQLEQKTDRYGNETLSYIYDPNTCFGRITQVTVGPWSIVYDYLLSGVNFGRINKITVTRGGNYIKRVNYTYHDGTGTYATDTGNAGDLIMVCVREKATGDATTDGDNDYSIRRVTQYRYYRACSDGGDHQLKLVFSPASVKQAMADAGTSDATVLLGLADADHVDKPGTSKPALQDYANVKYTYYTTDASTSSLETDYGASGGLNESGFAKTQTIRKDWGGYLGTRTYYYMTNNANPGSNLNAVERITVEDTAVTGTRNVYGLNKDGQLLREVFVDDPAGSPKYWCISYVLGETKDSNTNNVNEVVQKRLASAHSCIDSLAKVRTFLDANCDNDWTSSDILKASDGVIYLYAYNADGFLVEETVKRGRSGSPYYLRALEYGDGTANKPSYLPVKEYNYPASTTTKTDASRLTTEYAYTFHDTSTVAQQLKTRVITYPTVGQTENGSGVATTYSEYYDNRGRLRWTQDGEGHVNYYSYHQNTGGLGYMMVDVKTNSLPAAITSGSEPDWLAYDGNVPFTHTDTDSLQLATKYTYDSSARRVVVEDPLGGKTATAYRDNATRTYAGWTGSGTSLPIRVVKTNDDDLATDVYTVDPQGVTIGSSGNLPTGNDTGETQADYITWTRYGYNATTALVEKADRYHNIPASGNGTMSTDFYRTFYRYDGLGRRTHVIQVVSGTDETGLTGCVEQVTRTEYDKLGRVKSVSRGVSGPSHVMKTTVIYDTDPTDIRKTVENYRDEPTPGTATEGVGDGFITSTLAYYDAANIDADHAIKTIYRYNWRGQLRGVQPGTAPYIVQDVDNMGRVRAVAKYQDALTWTGGTWPAGSGVVEDEDYAASVASDGTTSAKRGSLTKLYYDQMGRQYRAELYAVSASTGAAGGALTYDRYLNRNSRLVGVSLPASGDIEYALDGAGRRTETRVVTALKTETRSTVVYHYSEGGAYLYRAPEPKNAIGELAGDNDRVIQLAHYVYDAAGNVTGSITLEVNHDLQACDDGLDATNHDNYVQTATYNWFEADTYYLKTTAYYGSGDADGKWKYASLPSYAAYGDRPSSSSSSCLVIKYDYVKGRLDHVTAPNGSVVYNTYDALGRTTRAQEKDSSATELRSTLTEYDGLSNVVKLTADLNHNGSPDSGTDQITEYTYYDSTNSPYDASWTTKIKYPDSTNATWDVVSLAYNLDGTLKSWTDQKHQQGDAQTVLEFDWDPAVRRPVKQRVHTVGTGTDDLVRAIGLTYDSLGRRQRIRSYTDETDEQDSKVLNEVYYTYNSLGLLAQEHQEHEGVKDGDTLSVQYNYGTATGDTAGSRLENMIYPNGRKLFFNYGSSDANDELSRLDCLIDDNGSGSAGDVLAGYEYNGVSRLAIEDFTQPDVRLDYYRNADGTATSGTYQGFDRFGRVKQQAWRAYTAEALREHLNYGYDYSSNRTWRENVLAAAAGKMYDEKYDHDPLNRLTGFKQGRLSGGDISAGANRLRGQEWELTDTGGWKKFKLDANGDGDYEDDNPGNDLEQNERSHDAANQITGINTTQGTDWADPAYDACGNMTTVPKPAALTSAFTCVYDAWNRLVRVSSGEDQIAEYRYDGLNRRIRKYTDPGVDATWTVREVYYNAAWQLLEVRKQTRVWSGAEPALSQTLNEQYVWSARYIDAPVCRDRDSDGDGVAGDGSLGKTDSGLDERLYYATDANMNVTALMDTSGAAVERYFYDPYGMVTYLQGSTDSQNEWQPHGTQASSVDNCVLYCGYWRDSETGLDYVRHRYRQPYLGWITRHRLEYVPGPGRYEYCRGRPTGFVDPSGNPDIVEAAKAVARAANAVGDFVCNVAAGVIESQPFLPAAPAPTTDVGYAGRVLGRAVAAAEGVAEVVTGKQVAELGIEGTVASGGGAAVVTVPITLLGAGLMATGVVTIGNAILRPIKGGSGGGDTDDKPNAAGQAGKTNQPADAPKNTAPKGSKSLQEYQDHMGELADARKNLDDLRKQLKEATGPKSREPIQEEIDQLERSISGHEKEIRQKWPNGAPAE